MSLYYAECPFCGKETEAEGAEVYSNNPLDRACPECFKREHKKVCLICGNPATEGSQVCSRECFLELEAIRKKR